MNIEIDREQLLIIINFLISEATRVRELLLNETIPEEQIKNRIISLMGNMHTLQKIAIILRLNSYD